MDWIPWILGGTVAVVILVAMLLVGVAFAARAWGGEAVGALRARKRYMNGTHTRLRVAVRRSVRGKAALRDVHVLVGPALGPTGVILSQVEAIRCAELLDRAAAEAGPRS
ncbi:MAG: hypothetical protein ACXWG1_17020 [Usitatibacter sp.]